MPARISRLIVTIALTLFATLLVARPALAAPSPSPTVPTDLSMAFPDQDIHGGSTSLSETFTNFGAVDETVSSMAIGGADTADFTVVKDSCSGKTLAQFDTCDVQVNFQPTSAGLRSASLDLTDMDSRTSGLPLTGTGQTGTLTATTPTFQPQPTYYGDPQAGFQLSNSSSNWSVQGTSYSFTGPDAARFYLNGGDFCLNSMLYNPGNSCFINVSMHSADPGTYHASLEVTNDGTASPVVIPLDVTVLNGPHASTPGEVAAGAVKVGTDHPEQVTVTNTGDSPLPIGEITAVTGHPDVFFLSDDNCTGHQVDPGASCQITAHFKPTRTGDQEASLFIITGTDQAPVTSIGLTGTGIADPSGTANLTGTPQAGHRLSCDPRGYPEGSGFAYQWLSDGDPLASAPARRTLLLSDADVGSRISCTLTASATGGRSIVRSAASAPVTPRDLAGLPGAFVSSRSCRAVAAGRTLHAGSRVNVAYGSPVTTGDPLRLGSTAAMRVGIDGESVDSGATVAVTPTQLAQFPDGVHTLTVRAGGRTAREPVLLSGCRIGIRVAGGDRRASRLAVSARAGMSGFTITLPRALRLRVAAGHAAGLLTYRSAGAHSRIMGLAGPRSRSGGVVVSLSAHGVRVTGLPAETGVVRLSFRPGVITGGAGAVRIAATLRGDAHATHAAARSAWSR